MPFLFKTKIPFVFIIAITLVGGFSAGYYSGKLQVPPAPVENLCNQTLGASEQVDFSLFWDAWRLLEKRFVFTDRIDAKTMVYGAISGMVASLDDPYTIFFPPEETKKFIEDVNGSFEGVGMEIAKKKGQLMIISPIEGTPAQKAGLKANDKILKINGTSTDDLTVEEAVSYIRGPGGTDVTLTIARESWDEPKEITITRAVIEVPSMKWEIKEGNIAYVELYQFSEKLGNDFRRSALEIINSPADRIIIDLRNNPGGYLEISQDVAGWFLNRGDIVTIEDFGGKEENINYKAQGNEKFLAYPVVILINGGSASASEILAGALRDNRGVKLIGIKSFGKGSVQELEDLRDGSSLKITVARWLTPKGVSITEKGLEPDIEVEMTDEDIINEKDPQLDKAIEIIKGL